MVQIDQKTIYVIGGHHNHKDQKKTWIVDPNNVDESDQLILQKGPKMKHRRVYHCSSKMKLGEKVILVAVGGSCKTVELLDTSDPDQKWILGKDYK